MEAAEMKNACSLKEWSTELGKDEIIEDNE